MNHREVIRSIRQRPRLYGIDDQYSTAVAFIIGYDTATAGLLLSGFKEWLIVRLDYGNNLTWPSLAKLYIAANEAASTDSAVEDVELSLDHLFSLLDEFLEERDRANGLLRIYNKYLTWLKSQKWFSPEVLE